MGYLARVTAAAALILLAAPATAADEQHFTWDVTLDGKPIGQRTMTVKYQTSASGDDRRVLEVWTELDATVLGLDYRFRERMTAHVGSEVAAFHASQELSGDLTEVQARRGALQWTVTVNRNGKESTREYPASSIDLSTADLLDPDSRVPLSRFPQPKVLSAEGGELWTGDVTRLGASELVVAGEKVAVEGYRFTPASGPGSVTSYYTADGYLVRYQLQVLGKELTGTLNAPPPVSADEAPVELGGSGITEIEL